MGVMTFGGKNVIAMSIGGKLVSKFVDNSHTFSFNTPHATMTDYNPPTYGFSSIPQYDAFRALSNPGPDGSFITVIPANAFFTERKLIGLTLGSIQEIGDQAFQQCPLTYIYIPSATTIGENAFQSVVNAATTKVIMDINFNTPTEKDRIFGAGHWSNIAFTWVGTLRNPIITGGGNPISTGGTGEMDIHGNPVPTDNPQHPMTGGTGGLMPGTNTGLMPDSGTGGVPGTGTGGGGVPALFPGGKK